MRYKKILKVVLLVCLAVLGFGGWYIYFREQNKQFEALREQIKRFEAPSEQISLGDSISGQECLYGSPPTSFKDEKKLKELLDSVTNVFDNLKNED